MSTFSKDQKTELSALIGEGHRRFGKLAPRRPYTDDDDKGGGAEQNVFESHPLLNQQPIGASSDLTFIITENNQSLKEAEKRADQATPELKKQLELALDLSAQKQLTAAPKLVANPY